MDFGRVERVDRAETRLLSHRQRANRSFTRVSRGLSPIDLLSVLSPLADIIPKKWGQSLTPQRYFRYGSDWRGCRQPLDVAINASASAVEAGVEAAVAVEVGAAGADGASRGGDDDDGGGDGQQAQPSCVHQGPEARPLRSATRVSLHASGRPLRPLRVRLRQKPREV